MCAWAVKGAKSEQMLAKDQLGDAVAAMAPLTCCRRATKHRRPVDACGQKLLRHR
jgi:hypothetical protein